MGTPAVSADGEEAQSAVIVLQSQSRMLYNTRIAHPRISRTSLDARYTPLAAFCYNAKGGRRATVTTRAARRVYVFG